VKKLLVVVLINFSLLYAKTCNFEYEVIYQIAANERHPQRDVGYPYLISFNNQSDMEKIVKKFENKYIKLDNRTIDCKSLDVCINIFRFLWINGISNIDLGAFSINPRFYKAKEPKEYFDLKDSSDKVCEILEKLKEKYGWSWETMGKYHSWTKELNTAYTDKIQQRIGE